MWLFAVVLVDFIAFRVILHPIDSDACELHHPSGAFLDPVFCIHLHIKGLVKLKEEPRASLTVIDLRVG